MIFFTLLSHLCIAQDKLFWSRFVCPLCMSVNKTVLNIDSLTTWWNFVKTWKGCSFQETQFTELGSMQNTDCNHFRTAWNNIFSLTTWPHLNIADVLRVCLSCLKLYQKFSKKFHAQNILFFKIRYLVKWALSKKALF